MLKITYKKLKEIMMCEDDENFEVLFDNIPFQEGDNIQDFIEDDGRQYRSFIFKDKTTNIEYSFSYIWNPHFDISFPLDFMDTPEGIEFVKEEEPAIVVEEKVLTEEEKKDKELWANYLSIEVKPFTNLKDYGLKKKDIQFIFDFLNTKNWNMMQLRAQIIPVCSKHGIEQKSFWNYIQKTKKR